MKFTREQSEELYTVHAFSEEEAILNVPHPVEGRDEEGRLALAASFVITPNRLLQEWPPAALEQLSAAHLADLKSLEMEVLLLGTGRQIRFPAAGQMAALVELGVGYEVMDSAAACRTYNILAGEGRKVVAAVIMER